MAKGRIVGALLFPSLLAAGLVVTRFDLSGYLPACKFHQWTGLHCPGCGGTRAFNALSGGDITGALGMNPLSVLLILAVFLLALRTSWEAMFPDNRWPRLPLSDRWAWVILIGIVFFAVLRNLPWWPLTMLAPH